MKNTKRALHMLGWTVGTALAMVAVICLIAGLAAAKNLYDNYGPSAKQQLQLANQQHDHQLAMIKIMIDDIGYEMGRGDIITGTDRVLRLQEYVEKLPFKNGVDQNAVPIR